MPIFCKSILNLVKAKLKKFSNIVIKILKIVKSSVKMSHFDIEILLSWSKIVIKELFPSAKYQRTIKDFNKTQSATH